MKKIICLVLSLLPIPAFAGSQDATDFISSKHADAQTARLNSQDMISSLRNRRQGVNLMSFAEKPNSENELEPAAGAPGDTGEPPKAPAEERRDR